MGKAASFGSPVVRRRVLWAGDSSKLISLKIPKDAKIIRHPRMRKSYACIPRSVKGGVVWLYVYVPHNVPIESIRGTTVTARIDEVVLRTTAREPERIYVDLSVLPGEDPTIELRVHSRRDEAKEVPHVIFLRDVPRTEGCIVILPVTEE